MAIKDRFNELIKHFADNNKKAFAETIGISPTVIENVVGKREGNPSFEVLQKIKCAFANVNMDWLISENGSMLNEEMIDAKLISYKESKDAIPLVNQFVAAGFGSAEFHIEKSDVKAYYVVPKFKDRKIDFMIEVAGSSMYPKYNSGDVIACTILKDSKFIQWNKVHVIATIEQGLLVKRIKENGNDSILAVSDNQEYPLFSIPKNEITGLALVVGVIRLE